MTRTATPSAPTRHRAIRLVGGPRPVDGTVLELVADSPDAADLRDGQFVRALRGSTVTALATLQRDCTDRRSAEELARSWRAVVFAPASRPRRRRPQVFRYVGTHVLDPSRDARGCWHLRPGGRVQGALAEPAPPPATDWRLAEHALDEAVARFHAVADLLPPGPLASRADDSRRAVAACVRDGARLTAVAAAVGGDEPALAEGIRALATRIDAATRHLVVLHLELTEPDDPAGAAACLARAWREVR